MVTHLQVNSESIHSVIPAEDFISNIEMSEKYAAFDVPNSGGNDCMSLPKFLLRKNLHPSLTAEKLDKKIKEANERKSAILKIMINSIKLRSKPPYSNSSPFDDKMKNCNQSFHEERLKKAEIRRNEQLKKVIQRARDYSYCFTTLINHEENIQKTKELIERKLKLAEMRRQAKLQNRIENARRRNNSFNDKEDESSTEMKIEAYEQKLKQAEQRRLEKIQRKLDRIRYRSHLSYILSSKHNGCNDSIAKQSESKSLAFEIKLEPPKTDLKAYPKRLIDKFFTAGLTHEEIQAKLEIAEQRRNHRLQKRINQIANRLCAYKTDSEKQNKSIKNIDDEVSCDENGRTIAFQMMESPKVYFTAVPKRLYCNSKRPTLTHDGIEMKLQEAEKRRQEKQQYKLEKRKKCLEEYENSDKSLQDKRKELDEKMRRVAERKKAITDAKIERMRNNIEHSFKIDLAFQRLLQNEAWKKGLAGTEEVKPLSETEIDAAVNEVVLGINTITKKLDKDIEHAKNAKLEELNAFYVQ